MNLLIGGTLSLLILGGLSVTILYWTIKLSVAAALAPPKAPRAKPTGTLWEQYKRELKRDLKWN